ncbi:phosphonate ABC transporter, permease protein PhnE [Alloalcanivorax xenomutans]|jgi:phosphonate transport system permease protein|uniref:Phosphonate ABC transporter, permease protein PhnE n=1 Tax=Alloalcanivorax xenomutans TaxID=1094342 RepID=A0A9Q3ZEY6_9GAMM|nr:phosphonate ABC transporter, permease protein PhnE [Alloalcanivorax xenomutans]MCE7511215.1 phosphonate ABC transporter, permease protein PhnE [Alloalcanivorax xenomutans]
MQTASAQPEITAIPPGNSWMKLFGWGLFLAALAWSWGGAEMKPQALWNDADNMATFLGDFFPPDFSEWRYYFSEMVTTVQIAIWGTFLAIIFAIPFAILSSENLVPWWVCQPVRRLMDASRAINEMVFAMLFVVAVGLGPFAGVMALFVHTTGVLAKLFSEAVEAIDPGPVEGVRATGATSLQEIIFGVIPQVMPLWISYSLYRFESNVRSATVVGMVGAGGIGVILWESMRGFMFAQTCAVMIVIIVVVTALDIASQWIRKRFI